MMFTLAISCLTTSNLPWFMDLTFQIPMKYCSLQHWTLLPLLVHPQLGVVFALLYFFIISGIISPFFSSSILGTYWPGDFIFQCHIFLSFYTVHMFSRQEHWSGLPFPFSFDHVLSELSTTTHPSWVALHSMERLVLVLSGLYHFLWQIMGILFRTPTLPLFPALKN